MKYKKYILLLVFILLISLKPVYAESKKITTHEYTPSIMLIEGNPQYSINGYNPSKNKISCGQLIDAETKQLIKEVLAYPRYIIPAIIIALGSLDLFKAVIAGKEDEMKKAQKTFMKRVIIGVLVYLVPALVNVIIWLANIAWEGLGYTTCPM
jgi:hypothetical protein